MQIAIADHFHNWTPGAIGYFSFSSMSRLAMAGLVLITSLVAIGCFLLSAHIHSTSKADLAAILQKYDS